MDSQRKYNIYSIEESLKIPSMKAMAEEMIRNSAAIRRNSYFKEKYLKTQRSLARMYVKRYLKENPEWGLRDILTAMVKLYPAEMPPEILLKMVHNIVEEWQAARVEEPKLALAEAV